MRFVLPKLFAFTIAIFLPCIAFAQSSGDEAAVNRVIDQVFELELAKDMTAQAELMADDRIWIFPGLGRKTDQALNMEAQIT